MKTIRRPSGRTTLGAIPPDQIPLTTAFLALLFIYRGLHPALFSLGGLRSVSTQFLPLILAAMAQSLIMVAGGIDLSIGVQISLTTCILARFTEGSVAEAAGGLMLAATVSVLIGISTGCLVSYLRMPAMIVTLGTSFMISGIALLVMPVPGGSIPSWLMNWYSSDALGIVPVPTAILILILAAWKILKSYPLGLAIYATGDNETSAFVSGVPTSKMRLAAYGLAGILTMLAGTCIAAQIGCGDPNLGAPYTLNSIAASVLGGASFAGGECRMRGTVLGALTLGFLFNVLFFSGISPFYQYVVQGLALIGAVGLKSLARIDTRRCPSA